MLFFNRNPIKIQSRNVAATISNNSKIITSRKTFTFCENKKIIGNTAKMKG